MEKEIKTKTMNVNDILKAVAGTTTGYEVEIQTNIEAIKAILYSTVAFSGMEGYGISDDDRKQIVDYLDEAMEKILWASDIIRANGGIRKN